MKYGQTLRQRSVPQWAYNNLDYNELKHLIKVHTTRGQGQAIAVPGHDDVALQRFENAFFHELYVQHERIDDFVRDKANEIGRRLQDYHDRTGRLLAKLSGRESGRLTLKQRERLSRLEGLVLRCQEDALNLQRYVEAQALGFHKLLKKYKKWTGSPTLGIRFRDEVLSDPKSLVNRDFSPLIALAGETLAALRAASPDDNGAVSHPTEGSGSGQRSNVSQQRQDVAPVRQTYWNEYEDGSDVENHDEPYAIYIEPEAMSKPTNRRPSTTTLSRLHSMVKTPIERLQSLFQPPEPAESQPLMSEQNGRARLGLGRHYGAIRSDIDSDNDDASSSDFPSGYTAHYASFPSVADQRYVYHRERLLFQTTIGCFTASFVLALIAGVLIGTGKHKLRAEVDAGAMVGVVASLCFATMGLGAMLSRSEFVGWVQRVLVGAAFVAVCVTCGILLVFIAANA